ncbi:MAG TPA: SDR family NAD(P)-dependent oxidoreductase [Methylomirabilota bacterium]|jgi:3-oxoacyl-[acyl-carrier protein] reductase|nr:SDR family NAD(P)-dependent oxidoreductase [Methylomirabilota bacterium]
MKLAGRVAIVTGSSMGIGEGMAAAFLREGARIIVNSREQKRADQAAARLAKIAGEADRTLAVAADVSTREGVDRLVGEAVQRWGRLDIMVNNAGTSMIAPSAELSETDWRRTIDLNLTGAFFGCQASARVMLPKRSGSIINVGSILGQLGLPKRAAYCASKHGLIGLTKVLGTEWGRQGVRVNCINPGYIKTPMDVHDQAVGDYTDADITRRTPAGRFGSVEEIATVAVWLASDDAAYVTGTTVDVDGGWVAYAGWGNY